MNNDISPDDEQVNDLYNQLSADAQSAGYNLNPDADFAKDLVRGLLSNNARYGYQSCPCRLAEGDKVDDLDIICPCDYRDDDIDEYGFCYCALYVSQDIIDGKKQVESIPERRPEKAQRKAEKQLGNSSTKELEYPVWRCTVCGYLCARNEPPGTCPICKAGKERFVQFM